MKYNPNIIVIVIIIIVIFIFLLIKLWCLHVNETPELKRIIVFKRGIENGFKGKMPKGGQILPIWIAGDNLKWKKAQKKDKKKLQI